MHPDEAPERAGAQPASRPASRPLTTRKGGGGGGSSFNRTLDQTFRFYNNTGDGPPPRPSMQQQQPRRTSKRPRPTNTTCVPASVAAAVGTGKNAFIKLSDQQRDAAIRFLQWGVDKIACEFNGRFDRNICCQDV